MRTYNFLVTIGSLEYIVDINALNEEEAFEIISKEYPKFEGWNYYLI